ncbi:MAG: DsbA family protein [Alphaproteobacteria bacterium]
MILIRVLASMAAIAALLVAMSARAEPLSTEDALKDRILGDPNAPVEIIEYASLTCPHCQKFHLETLPEIKKKYIDTGKVKLVYRDFPFEQVGLMAAVMARCAPPIRYFQFLEVLFQNQEQWSRSPNPGAALVRIGKLGGLSEDDFQACMNNKQLVDGLLQVRLDANKRFDVTSTPTFVINGDKRVVGFQAFAVFDELLEKLTK